LPETIQREILEYEFVVDLLHDMPDADVYDIFARINTYSVTLNAQEKRNARWFGEFKSAAYAVANELVTFWQNNSIFTAKQMLRMAEVEFVSELLIAAAMGIQERKKLLIDRFYREWDDAFPSRIALETKCRAVIDVIGGIFGDDLQRLEFRATRLFYPLFCALYHLKFGLPDFRAQRVSFKSSDYPRMRMALEGIHELLERVKEAGEALEGISLSASERSFCEAFSEHWVHADKRTTMAEHICKVLVGALRG
jgi:hypothetical protein